MTKTTEAEQYANIDARIDYEHLKAVSEMMWIPSDIREELAQFVKEAKARAEG